MSPVEYLIGIYEQIKNAIGFQAKVREHFAQIIQLLGAPTKLLDSGKTRGLEYKIDD